MGTPHDASLRGGVFDGPVRSVAGVQFDLGRLDRCDDAPGRDLDLFKTEQKAARRTPIMCEGTVLGDRHRPAVPKVSDQSTGERKPSW